MKTGTNPMRSQLKLFLDWGIRFEEAYEVSEKSARRVSYADKEELEKAILQKTFAEEETEMVIPQEDMPEEKELDALQDFLKNRRHRRIKQMKEE